MNAGTLIGILFILYFSCVLTDGCGFVSTASGVVQTFSTPHYPNSYPNNLNCFWNFSAPSGSRVRVDFTKFVTEDCCDFLSVIQREGVVSEIRGNLTVHEYLVSSDSWIAFRFISDNELSHSGFRATFRAVANEFPRLNIKCGFNATAGSEPQTLRSVGWPNNYVDDLFCVWEISARPGYRIRIDFDHFDTEECCDNFAILHENMELLRIAGNVSIVQPLISPSNHVRLEFYSDDDLTFRGFTGTFRETRESTYMHAPCGDNLSATDSPQNIFSPGYPGAYENRLNCIWHITAEEGRVISLSLVFSRVEKCCDILTVFDGDSQEGVNLDVEPQHLTAFVSTTNRIRLRFTSDRSRPGPGFQISFASTDLIHPPLSSSTIGGASRGGLPSTGRNTDVICGFGARATTIKRSLTSPSWPMFYPMDVSCEWTLQARRGLRVRVDFLFFHTEPADYLSIIEENREVLRLKGNLTISTPLISRGDRLVLRFYSDDSVHFQGFQATFKETSRPYQLPFAPCGGTVTATSLGQYINSPGWPLPYEGNLNCTWTIQARAGFRIHLNFGLLDTEKCCDYLEGLNEHGQEVFKLRGSKLTSSRFTSHNNLLRLRFSSDTSINGRGFQLTFSETNNFPDGYGAPCGFSGLASKNFQELKSPNWPLSYANDLDCEWSIMGNRKRTIQLHIISFYTEQCCDFLDIFDTERLMLRLAGDVTVNSYVNTTTNLMKLRFYSDATVFDRGFRAEFRELPS